MLTNSEILKIYLDNGLIEKCLMYQFGKLREPWKKQFSGDMMNDLCIIIQEYDNAKLNDAHNGNHMNAWLTRVIQNNLYSVSSRFYTTYIKFMARSNDLGEGPEDDGEDGNDG